MLIVIYKTFMLTVFMQNVVMLTGVDKKSRHHLFSLSVQKGVYKTNQLQTFIQGSLTEGEGSVPFTSLY
jgi:hypothetical protein